MTSAIERLHNRIDLFNIPFTDRGSRLLLFRRDNTLALRLAERWAKWEREVGHYRQRPPIVTGFTLLDENGSPLPFDVDTYPHVAAQITPVGRFDWAFVDPETLIVRLPSGRYGFSFTAYADSAQTDRRGGTMRGKRNIAYTTNAKILHNDLFAPQDGLFRVTVQVEAEEGAAWLFNVTPRLGFNRSVPNPTQIIDNARAAWEAWFKAAPPVLDELSAQYDYAWWVMRAGLLNTRYYFTREALVPSKIHYVGVWHWDQFFHALAFRHVDTRLAEDQIRIVLDHQRADGMLPDAIHDEGLVTHLTAPVEADVTKPPLAAWTAMHLYRTSGHLDFLDEIYEPLVRWNDWWLNYNVNQNGLCEYRHPFSSGLDDSPLWDAGVPVVSPDLNTYLCNAREALAQIADLLGLPEDARKHRAEADKLAIGMMRHLWDEKRGYFVALHDDKPVEVLTPFNLMPLCTGRLPDAITRRLLDRLTNPEQFWTPYPLPTVALNDPKFDPLQMWRGPSWANINYLFVEGLKTIGQHELARELRRRTLNMLMLHDDIYEYYHPVTGERPAKAAPMFGWSSAVFIDLALQETAERVTV